MFSGVSQPPCVVGTLGSELCQFPLMLLEGKREEKIIIASFENFKENINLIESYLYYHGH